MCETVTSRRNVVDVGVEPIADFRKPRSKRRETGTLSARENRELVSRDRLPAPDERPRMAIRNADVADGTNERPVLPDRTQQGEQLGGHLVQGVAPNAYVGVEFDL
jgi:hypothetical protein